ncbi:hypothetical protein PPH41_14720, partial [Burkholderia gladioli]|nr:hypothetical protein [Burkholderia gladioli]
MHGAAVDRQRAGRGGDQARQRAQHDIFIGEWSPDYMDPNSNARGFAWNPDNSDNAPTRMLA